MTLDANVSLIVQDEKDYNLELKKSKKQKLENDSLNNLENDYDYIRKNLKHLIDKGLDILDGASSVANESESPRAYGVCGEILKSVMELNTELMKLNQDALAISESINIIEENEEEQPKQITNQNLFVGTTKDLAQLIREMKGNV